MDERWMTNFRAAIRAHLEDVLIARGRLIGWSTIVGILVLWALGASRPLATIGSPLPLLNIVELCILTVAVAQLHRAHRPRHIVGVATAMCCRWPPSSRCTGCGPGISGCWRCG